MRSGRVTKADLWVTGILIVLILFAAGRGLI